MQSESAARVVPSAPLFHGTADSGRRESESGSKGWDMQVPREVPRRVKRMREKQVTSCKQHFCLSVW